MSSKTNVSVAAAQEHAVESVQESSKASAPPVSESDEDIETSKPALPQDITNNENSNDTTTERRLETDDEDIGSDVKSKDKDDLYVPSFQLELLGPSYARNAQFWKRLLFSAVLQGGLMAMVAVAFFVAYTELQDATWMTSEYKRALDYTDYGKNSTQSDEDALDPLRLGNGKWWYVGLLAGGGFGVGLIKVVWSALLPKHAFPPDPPGLVDHIEHLEAEDLLLPIPLVACSILSIGVGAVVGPEMSLGASGTTLGTFLAQRWDFGFTRAKPIEGSLGGSEAQVPKEYSLVERFLPDFSQDRKALGLDGMVAALGALLPSQYLSPLLLFELGITHFFAGGGRNKTPLFHFTEATAVAGIASSVSYAVFTALKQETILDQIAAPLSAYDIIGQIEGKYLIYGGILGFICGIAGFIGIICLGIGSAAGMLVFAGIQRISGGISWALLLTPAVGGALVGLLAVASPLILGDGTDQLEVILTAPESLGAKLLIATMFFKLLAVGISLGFGFIGGQIFPLLFSGACLGAAAHVLVPEVPLLVAYPACMVALPCAFLPALFTFTTLVSMTLVLGGSATTPLFTAAVVSNITVSGLGLAQRLIMKAEKRQQEKQREREQQQEESQRPEQS